MRNNTDYKFDIGDYVHRPVHEYVRTRQRTPDGTFVEIQLDAQYVYSNGEVVDRKQRKKAGKVVNLYLVSFEKTHPSNGRFGYNPQQWFQEHELVKKKRWFESNWEIMLTAIKRIFKTLFR